MSSTPLLADSTGGRPVVPSRGRHRPLGLHEVQITGGFWADRQATNGTDTLEHARTWMDKLGWTGNFATVHDGPATTLRRGREFSDSEVYKLMEAMSWEVGRRPGAGWEADLRELSGALRSAQAPDGYLHTAFGRAGQPPRYHDFTFGHELYCTGHLIQAAVARARTAGPDDLLAVARRAADHVCDTFGPDGRQSVCGHPEIESALVELARLTGEGRYLDQAALFVQRRGHRTLPQHHLGWSYFSDDVPVREARILHGHAVRALYLAAGAVDVAVETGDEDLLATVAAQFDSTLSRRTYLTGGMGSRHTDEAFGADFVLPADRSYAETCAGVAAVMLAWRLLLATGEPRYAAFVERALYNVVATGIGDDGRCFFYANTLHQRTPTELVPADREQLGFGGGPRAPWFEVSCCLPNIARLLASLSGYLVTAVADGLHLHHFADLRVDTRLGDGRAVGLLMQTGYPDTGAVAIRITAADAPWSLGVRVPEWATGAVAVDRGVRRPVTPGAVAVFRDLTLGDEIGLDLPMRPRWTAADPRIDAVRGCVAVERGPLVLCAESVDQPGRDLDALRVDTRTPPEPDDAGAVVVGGFADLPEAGWPYPAEPPTVAPDPVPVRLVPYHRWARRGPSTMRVWLPTT
ncbi:glycoside hydrolase family 127 protein [Micromonospora sp. SH-82]|uniref:glycoside hydrolase family 127 protein n=1 Tax=Micromonospora sp. SH-82 TaxID=3132938 RepID=UPI003EBA85B0